MKPQDFRPYTEEDHQRDLGIPVRASIKRERDKLKGQVCELLTALEDAEFLLRKAGQLAGPMRDSFNRSAADARAAIAKAKG